MIFQRGHSYLNQKFEGGHIVTPSLMDSPSLDHMLANDPKGIYIGR